MAVDAETVVCRATTRVICGRILVSGDALEMIGWDRAEVRDVMEVGDERSQ
jgi:hypothetical protein